MWADLRNITSRVVRETEVELGGGKEELTIVMDKEWCHALFQRLT